MFVYLFGLGVGLFLPLAAYLLFRRSNRTTEQPDAAVLQNFEAHASPRQLGRAVLPEETTMASPNRQVTPRRLSFSSALMSGDPMGRPALRNRPVVSSPRQRIVPSPLIGPNQGARLTGHAGGGLVDYVTRTRLKKDHELNRSPVMVRVKPAAPPPVAPMVVESSSSNREMVVLALKQKTRRKRAISSDTDLEDSTAAKRKRPPEGFGQGTKRQAADTSSHEGHASTAKRTRNISGGTKGKGNQLSDKGKKRQASPPTLPDNKRPVVQQEKGRKRKTKVSTATNRLLLDDDVVMDDAVSVPSKKSQKQAHSMSDHDHRSATQLVGSTSAETEESTSQAASKEKKGRRTSRDEAKPAVQVFESNIPVYSPSLRKGVALRRFVPLHSDPKAPLQLPAQMTKGKKYTKEDIEHDRQAAHSRVEYLLAEDEEDDNDGDRREESEDQTVSKDTSDTKDKQDGSKSANAATSSTATEPEEPSHSTDSANTETRTAMEENRSEVQTSATSGQKLGEGEIKILPPPPYHESGGHTTTHQISNEQTTSHSNITAGWLQQPSTLISKTSSAMEPPKPSFSLETTQKGVAGQGNKPLFSFPPVPSLIQSETPSVSSSQPTASTRDPVILQSTGFSLKGGISFASAATPHTENTTAPAVSHDVVSPMSDEDMGETPHLTGTTPNATVKTAPKVSFNLLPHSQTQTPQQHSDANAATKLSFGLTPGQHKEQEAGKTSDFSFNFAPTPQQVLGQQTQVAAGKPRFSFGQNSSTPSGGLARQSTPSNFSFSLKPQDKPSGSGRTFRFGSPSAGLQSEQSAKPAPSFGALGGNQNAPSTFNFSLLAATGGQTPSQGPFQNQQSAHATPVFGTQQVSSGFLGNQSFTAGCGNSGQMGQTVGFTVGSSSSLQQRPVARARRRTQGKPR